MTREATATVSQYRDCGWTQSLGLVTCEPCPDRSIEYPICGISIIGHHTRVGYRCVTSREGSAPQTIDIPDLGHGDGDEVEDEADQDGQEADDEVQGPGLGVYPCLGGGGEIDFEGQEVLSVECDD